MREAEKLGREAVHERLRTIDRASYDSIPAGNLKRVVRALEFMRYGEPISAHNERERQKRGSSPYDCRFFALTDAERGFMSVQTSGWTWMMEQGP